MSHLFVLLPLEPLLEVMMHLYTLLYIEKHSLFTVFR